METEQQIEQTSFDGEYAGIHPPAIGVDQYFETEVGLMNHLLLRMIHLNWYTGWSNGTSNLFWPSTGC